MHGETGDWSYRTAQLLVSPVSGRLLGVIPIAVPALATVCEGWQSGLSAGTAVGLVLASVPALALAFGLHEAGHLLMFRLLGLRGRLSYRFPVDLRSVPLGAGYEHSVGWRLIARASAGWLANIVTAVAMAGVALAAGGQWSAWWWWFAAWQGVSALTATAWAAHAPLTDAASLSAAVRIRDRVSVVWSWREGNLDIRLEVAIERRAGPVRPRGADDGWWLWVSGLRDARIQGSQLLDLPAGEGELLLYARNGSGPLAIGLTGVVADHAVRLVTRGGTVVDIPP